MPLSFSLVKKIEFLKTIFKSLHLHFLITIYSLLLTNFTHSWLWELIKFIFLSIVQVKKVYLWRSYQMQMFKRHIWCFCFFVWKPSGSVKIDYFNISDVNIPPFSKVLTYYLVHRPYFCFLSPSFLFSSIWYWWS